MAFSISGQWLAPASSWFNGNDAAAASRQAGTRSRFTAAWTMANLLIEISRLAVLQTGRGLRPAAPEQTVFAIT
jgi:hypothetical protein